MPGNQKTRFYAHKTIDLYLIWNYILDFTPIFIETIVNIGEKYIYVKGAVSLLYALINIPMGFGVFLALQSQKKVHMI